MRGLKKVAFVRGSAKLNFRVWLLMPSDMGMNGWEFEIYSQNCDLTATRTTSGEGASFEIELMAGLYNIGELIPEGYEDWYLHDVYHYEDAVQIKHYEPPFSCGTKVENIQIKFELLDERPS